MLIFVAIKTNLQYIQLQGAIEIYIKNIDRILFYNRNYNFDTDKMIFKDVSKSNRQIM